MPQEHISPLEALRMYTDYAAYASFEEDTRGTIQAGRRADLVVLERDPRSVPPDEIRDIGVKLTMIGGEVRYGG